MADTIKEFLVSFGFGVDDSSRARAEAGTRAAEERITATNIAQAAKRLETERKANAARLAQIVLTGGQISDAEKRIVADQEKLRLDALDRERKVREDAAKRDRDRRDATFKQAQTQFNRLASLAIKTVAILDVSKALNHFTGGLASRFNEAAKGLERMYYAAQAAGSTVNGTNAFVAGIQQAGGSAEAATASLAKFGENVQKFQAFRDILEGMGIATRDQNGALRDSSVLMEEYLQKLAKMPRAEREARASGWGIDESTVQAGIRPETSGYIAQQRANQGAIGSDDDVAARSAAAFERSMRLVENLLGNIATRINTTFFDTFRPQLDAVASWLRDNGKLISDVIASVASGLEKLGASIVEAIAGNGDVKSAMTAIAESLKQFGNYIGSDDFKKSMKTLAADVVSVANAFRWALEKLGILPSSTTVSDRASAASADNVEANNMNVFGNAIVRGHKNWFGGRQDQTDEGKVRGRLDDFRHGKGIGDETDGGSRSWRNNNPGNIKFGPFAQRLGATGKDAGGFAVFPDYAAGRKAQESLWFESDSYKNKSLADAVAQWSPPSENDTAGIVKQYAGAAGVDPNKKMSDFTPQERQKLLDAQQAREGWHAGGKGGSVGGGDIVGKAEGMVGLREGEAAQALGHIMHAGEWCADFVNGMIEKNGGKGSGSAMARSFMNWGKAVGIADVKRGDVAVLNNGGHVGFFTGERDKNGRLGVIAGNTRDGRGGHDVEHYFVNPDSVTGARRGLSSSQAATAPPVKVEVTDDSAAKIGAVAQRPLDPARQKLADAMTKAVPITPASKAIHERLSAGNQAQADHQHFLNEKLVQAAHHGMLHPFLHGKALGDTEALRRSVHKSIKGDTNITHNPTFHVSGGDVRQNMEAARMMADRGQQDLIRNAVGMEA